MRLFILILVISLAFAAPLLVFGDQFDAAFSGEAGAQRLGEYGPWGWAIGLGLIVSDLVLPIPATAVMTVLGYIYGTVIGGLVGAAASVLAGLIAFGATRLVGRRAAVFLVGERDLKRAESFFQRRGGYAVAISRPLPLLPEVIACLAGLAGMPVGRFVSSLVCGSIPTGFAYAAIGAFGVEKPSIALLIGCVIPVLLWGVVQKTAMKHDRAEVLPPSADAEQVGTS